MPISHATGNGYVRNAVRCILHYTLHTREERAHSPRACRRAPTVEAATGREGPAAASPQVAPDHQWSCLRRSRPSGTGPLGPQTSASMPHRRCPRKGTSDTAPSLDSSQISNTWYIPGAGSYRHHVSVNPKSFPPGGWRRQTPLRRSRVGPSPLGQGCVCCVPS